MTSYVVGQLKAGKIKLTDMATVGKMPGDGETRRYVGRRAMFQKPCDQVSVVILIKASSFSQVMMPVVALADYVAGSAESFIGLMRTPMRNDWD